MRVVIDTNVLWVSVSRRAASHWIFQAILDGQLTLCVSTEILEEYAEIMTEKLGADASEAVFSVFDNLPNVNLITKYYRWLAITNDPDDDKFVDCAVAAGADCIVSEDAHFKALKAMAFPKVEAMTIKQFTQFFQESR